MNSYSNPNWSRKARAVGHCCVRRSCRIRRTGRGPGSAACQDGAVSSRGWGHCREPCANRPYRPEKAISFCPDAVSGEGAKGVPDHARARHFAERAEACGSALTGRNRSRRSPLWVLSVQGARSTFCACSNGHAFDPSATSCKRLAATFFPVRARPRERVFRTAEINPSAARAKLHGILCSDRA